MLEQARSPYHNPIFMGCQGQVNIKWGTTGFNSQLNASSAGIQMCGWVIPWPTTSSPACCPLSVLSLGYELSAFVALVILGDPEGNN